MDFFRIEEKEGKNGEIILEPDFVVKRTQDLMVQGKQFYAVWVEELGLWSTDEFEVQRIVDDALQARKEEIQASGAIVKVRYMTMARSGAWRHFRTYMQNLPDSYHPLDMDLVFENDPVKRADYASKRLPYSLESGNFEAWDKLVGTLYSEEEREKIEWCIGSIVTGDSKWLQKFCVFYGSAGTGKSTILNIVQKLFQGYTATFDARALGSNNNTFATDVFKTNPLVAIQHDGDLSKIEDNSKINSIVSHEEMTMNEKFKPSYSSRVNAFLMMGTNKPVRISDSRSGLLRRLIDIHPSGDVLGAREYQTAISQIDLQLGAIATHCANVYQTLGRHYYDGYVPEKMMYQTDPFMGFVEAHYDIFKESNGITLQSAYALYKEYCNISGYTKPKAVHEFRAELETYFHGFTQQGMVDGVRVRSYFYDFKTERFQPKGEKEKPYALSMDETVSIFDDIMQDQPAQVSIEVDNQLIPATKWEKATTTLKDINTHDLHYVLVPEHHIVVDFDIVDSNGKKSPELNLAAASLWPPTYAEYSKSGGGIHLHYIYEGDVSQLSGKYAEGIEVKTLLGNASLRRKLSKCNNLPIAHIEKKLPLKEKNVLTDSTMKNERSLRALIARNLRKEVHPGTKSSVDFIHKILEDAYKSGMEYDVTDMRGDILAFASNSTNQSMAAIKVVQTMQFVGSSEPKSNPEAEQNDKRLVFFDVEVFPNLFVVCWKYQESDQIVRMINPKSTDIEPLLKMNLVGFNNRRYDNHILYAAFMGYSNDALYDLSQKIIDNTPGVLFGEAYNLSYADIYDFSSKKQGLKKFEIELGIHHMELDLPWDQPVPEERWVQVADYCCNDVKATEAVFFDREGDFVARKILAELSGLSVNDTTQKHTARILFGDDRRPQELFNYTDLSEMFPGYEFDAGKSTYRGEVVGEGGLVRASPGLYSNVGLLDVASMHPTSIELLEAFGPYTARYSELKEARLAIKRGDLNTARQMMDGKLAPFLENEEMAEALAFALKIVINIVYGLTSAKFDNPFRDPRNKDNIVAKRGALFMMDLQAYLIEEGHPPIHIKTDSVKIPNITPEIIDKVVAFGKKYGYDFEHEATYDKLCLVNDAVYIAREGDKWTAVGAQFRQPYVFKKLFTNAELVFDDYCETKQVTQGAIYLDYEHDRAAVMHEGMRFVGKTGRFVPVKEGKDGAVMWRVKDDKMYAVTGTKGYLWVEADLFRDRPDEFLDAVDMSYFDRLEEEAITTINKFGSYEELVN